MSFVSRIFTIHRTAKDGEGYLLNLSLPLPPASQILDISWAISAESSLLHMASNWTRTREPLISERKLLTIKKAAEDTMLMKMYGVQSLVMNS